MPANGYPFQMAGGVPVVTAPDEIDTTTAAELRAILLEWHSRGYTTVVVDLTGTQFCDSAGLRELVWAHKRAVADGGGLRLVIPHEGAVLRIFTVTGLDGIILRFATLKQALAELPAAAARPPRRDLPQPPAGALASQPEDHGAPAADGRSCVQCGAVFVPQREHARFCGGDCRAAWNRAHVGDPAVEATALTWSIAAMSEAAARLPAVQVSDQERAFSAVEEAVWWVTMVDATLLRHHPGAYDTMMATHAPAGRQMIIETLAGLRFVRNWIGRGGGLDEVVESGEGSWRITGWTWKPVGERALACLPPRALAWERARHRAYQARLVGHTIGTTFGQAVTFLTLTGAGLTPTGAGTASDTDPSQPATPG